MSNTKAEVIAIGDELTSGVRLDTNTQWLSQRLGELGIEIGFHTTVGDDLEDMKQVFERATQRADLIVCTGGLGPTADDLTRHAMAEIAGEKLVLNESVLNHIKAMYQKRGREMPPNNEIQAWFPETAVVIDNPEGTAPGIDLVYPDRSARVFALPGVPVEMKQMWQGTVEPAIRKYVNCDFVIHHHTIHCFGSGESHIETLLPNLVQRGRDPQVGITASAATISLRVSTKGNSVDDCQAKMAETIATIKKCLGNLVFGENGAQLEEVVVSMLLKENLKLQILDRGLNGQVGHLISSADQQNMCLVSSWSGDELPEVGHAANDGDVISLLIGPVNRTESAVQNGESFYVVQIKRGNDSMEKNFRFSGHSGWRETRAVKDVLNFVRLYLLGAVADSTGEN